MRLYLMRHGEPVSDLEDAHEARRTAGSEVRLPVLRGQEPRKPLSANGRADVLKVAGFLAKRGVRPMALWHSTKERARETAKIIAKTLDLGKICEEHKGLAPNDAIGNTVEKIQNFSLEHSDGELLIAGHMPFLPRLATYLLTGEESGQLMPLAQAGVICLAQANETDWQILWIMTPELIG